MDTVCQPWTSLSINVLVSVLGVWGSCQQPMCEGSPWAQFYTYSIHITRWCWGLPDTELVGPTHGTFWTAAQFAQLLGTRVCWEWAASSRETVTSEEKLALLLILRDWNWDSPDFLLPRFSCSTLMNCNQTPSGIRDQRDQKGQLTELDQPKSLLLPRASF